MSKFSLSRKKKKVLPDTVVSDGSTYSVNPDFRNVLRILQMLDDADIMEAQRPYLLAKWFYKGDAPIDAYGVFREYITAFRENNASAAIPKKAEPQRFDFEIDAEEIYTSFFEQYGINLIDIDFLHWYDFIILLGGLGENTAFRKKIALRFIDTKNMKGDALTKVQKAKTAVQLPTKHNRREMQRMQSIEAALLGDGDLTGIL